MIGGPRGVAKGITSACAESTARGGFHALTVRNHLRLRGEHKLQEHDKEPGRESPPLARRALVGKRPARLVSGITSACAESTAPASFRRWREWNHLRLRGEHIRRHHERLAPKESPPLARRARKPRRLGRDPLGITSACAESTTTPVFESTNSGNHLRLRGEHPPRAETAPASPESPPLARRAPAPRPTNSRASGITSACAESTLGRCARPLRPGNHLRLRGEHTASAQTSGTIRESPPLARRAPDDGSDVLRIEGITSACAESTKPSTSTFRRCRNHLRLRGEHTTRQVTTAPTTESPPLARRARGGSRRSRALVGITSACAESTCMRLTRTRCGRNHLRLRGEHKGVEQWQLV